MFNDESRTLYLLELKSTKATSIPLTMIKDNQIKGLLEASEHNLNAGFFFNFRNENNDTFYMGINEFADMMKDVGKKSFNVADLLSHKSIRLHNEKKRVRYTYDIEKFVKKTCSQN